MKSKVFWIFVLLAACGQEETSNPAGVGATVGRAGGGQGAQSGGGGASGGKGGGTSGGAGGQPQVPDCISASALNAMAQPFSCESMPIVKAPVAWLPYDCHTQGIGVHTGSKQFVVTCQDQDGGTSGRLLSFSLAAGSGGQWAARGSQEIFIDASTPHPSAIQNAFQRQVRCRHGAERQLRSVSPAPLRIDVDGEAECTRFRLGSRGESYWCAGYGLASRERRWLWVAVGIAPRLPLSLRRLLTPLPVS